MTTGAVLNARLLILTEEERKLYGEVLLFLGFFGKKQVEVGDNTHPKRKDLHRLFSIFAGMNGWVGVAYTLSLDGRCDAMTLVQDDAEDPIDSPEQYWFTAPPTIQYLKWRGKVDATAVQESFSKAIDAVYEIWRSSRTTTTL